MDPAHPQRQVNNTSLTQVQRWVTSALAVVTIMHLSVGFVIGAQFLDQDATAARIGLNVIGAAFGVLAIASGLLLHKRSVLSPWLLLGLIPGIVGLVLVLR